MLAGLKAQDLREILQNAIRHRLLREQNEIGMFQSKVSLLDPENILRRGYSITMRNGKAVTSEAQLSPGDEIETKLHRGNVRSIVK
jgi:exodeoxyribonuclease VII large subunit